MSKSQISLWSLQCFPRTRSCVIHCIEFFNLKDCFTDLFFSLLTTGPSKAGSAGREFVLSFLTNLRFDNTARLQLFITAVEDNARVTVKTSIQNFQQDKTLRLGETFTVSVPPNCELSTGQKDLCSIIVHASADVVITAFNSKFRTADTSVVYPTTEWGTEYYVLTPANLNNKEFSVTNGNNISKVTVFVQGPFNFKGTTYKKGSKLEIILKPYESVLFKSNNDLTNTRVTSQQPVAVFTGHACTRALYSYCNHVYEQLLPVNKWGSTFVVPPVPLQTRYDIVYVTASQPTKINVKSDKNPYVLNLAAGTSKQLHTTQSSPLYLQADHGIQVLMFFGGAKLGATYYDSFLLSVLSTDRYCPHYLLRALETFDNEALIVAPNTALPKLRVDDKPLPQNTKWNSFPGTEYFWTQIDANKGNILSSSSVPFALYSLGFVDRNGYGSPGQCVQPGKMHAL